MYIFKFNFTDDYNICDEVPPKNRATPMVSPIINDSALIAPIEVDTRLCDAHLCKIEECFDAYVKWVHCDRCGSWLHLYCIDMTEEQLNNFTEYICSDCT